MSSSAPPLPLRVAATNLNSLAAPPTSLCVMGETVVIVTVGMDSLVEDLAVHLEAVIATVMVEIPMVAVQEAHTIAAREKQRQDKKDQAGILGTAVIL